MLVDYCARMENEFSTTQAAKRFGVSPITVRLWCRRGLFKNAHEMETVRGPVWMIPETDLVGFKPPKMGRPKKANSPPVTVETEEKAA